MVEVQQVWTVCGKYADLLLLGELTLMAGKQEFIN